MFAVPFQLLRNVSDNEILSDVEVSYLQCWCPIAEVCGKPDLITPLHQADEILAAAKVIRVVASPQIGTMVSCSVEDCVIAGSCPGVLTSLGLA